MIKKFSRYWWLWTHFRRLQLMKTFEYRGDFFFWSIVSLMWAIFNFFFFNLLTEVTGTMGGWTPLEVTAMMAISTIFDAFFWSFFYPNMTAYTRQIFTGELNTLLLRPIDTQFMLMTQVNSFDGIFRISLGSSILVWALSAMDRSIPILSILLAVVAFVTSLIFIYYLWFSISTLAFWVEKLENINEVLPSLKRIWQIPRPVYTGILSTIITVMVPFALVTSLPTEWLINQGSLRLLLYFMTFTALVVIFSRWFFNLSIKRYSGMAN